MRRRPGQPTTQLRPTNLGSTARVRRRRPERMRPATSLRMAPQTRTPGMTGPRRVATARARQQARSRHSTHPQGTDDPGRGAASPQLTPGTVQGSSEGTDPQRRLAQAGARAGETAAAKPCVRRPLQGNATLELLPSQLLRVEWQRLSPSGQVELAAPVSLHGDRGGAAGTSVAPLWRPCSPRVAPSPGPHRAQRKGGAHPPKCGEAAALPPIRPARASPRRRL